MIFICMKAVNEQGKVVKRKLYYKFLGITDNKKKFRNCDKWGSLP